MRPLFTIATLFFLVSIVNAASINTVDTTDNTSSKPKVYKKTSEPMPMPEDKKNSSGSKKVSAKKKPKKSTHALKFYVGYRDMETDAEHYTFTLLDDKTTQDTLSLDGKFRGTGSFGFGVGIETTPNEEIHREYIGEFQFGAFKLYSFQIGLGYNFNLNKSVTLRPKTNFGYARTILEVGDLKNNDYFIQIGDEKYYDNSLEVEVKSHNVLVTPSLDMAIKVNSNWAITANAGYQFAWTVGNPYMQFSSPSNDDKETKLSIDDNSVFFSIDNAPVSELPFNPNGFSVGIGFSLYL